MITQHASIAVSSLTSHPYVPRWSSDYPSFHRVTRLRSFHKDNTGDQSRPLPYYAEVVEKVGTGCLLHSRSTCP